VPLAINSPGWLRTSIATTPRRHTIAFNLVKKCHQPIAPLKPAQRLDNVTSIKAALATTHRQLLKTCVATAKTSHIHVPLINNLNTESPINAFPCNATPRAVVRRTLLVDSNSVTLNRALSVGANAKALI
jgi:hypothetical protein